MLFEDLLSFWGKENPEAGGREDGLPGDPWYGWDLILGTQGWCLSCSLSQSEGGQEPLACLRECMQGPAKLAPLHQEQFLPYRICRERQVFN